MSLTSVRDTSFCRRCLAIVAFAAFAAISLSADGKTLREATPILQWDAAKAGPLLVLEPDMVRSKPREKEVAAFGRLLVVVGRLTAVVPAEMVSIDDTKLADPDLYDGLPMNVKVEYLLSTLDANQWRLIGTRGVGLADLRDDQQAVLASILPQPLKWVKQHVNDDCEVDDVADGGTLRGEDVLKARLRLRRTLSLQITSSDGGCSFYSTSSIPGKGGQFAYALADATNPQTVFGVPIRRVIPNKIKPADIDYADSRLDVEVRLPTEAKVIELLKLVGAAASLDLLADIRVADRTVLLKGEAARAGDVLQALALSVTGTFRNVGGTYVLTSDLVGIGARKLRLSVWENQLRQTIAKREAEWCRQIRGSGGLDQVAFESDSGLEPNDEVLKYLANKASSRTNDSLPYSSLGINLQRFLDRVASESSRVPIKDRVVIDEEIRYGFVLPDGKPLQLCRQALLLDVGRDVAFEPGGPGLPLAVPASHPPIPILLRADSANEARNVVGAAARHGFRAVWLQTRSADALVAAIAACKALEVEIRLVLDPYAVQGQEQCSDPDRTILGDTGAELNGKLSRADELSVLGRNGIVPNPFPPCYRSPVDPTLASRWKEMRALARTAGLKGVVVVDTQPRGYESERKSCTLFGLAESFTEMLGFGYSTSMRRAFLQTNLIDPLDIAPNAAFSSDLRQPFFLDDNLRGGTTEWDEPNRPVAAMASMGAKWDEFRVGANRLATKSFLDSLSQDVGEVPIVVEGRLANREYPPNVLRFLLPWGPGDDIESLALVRSALGAPSKPTTVLLTFVDAPERQASALLASMAADIIRKADGQGVFDLTGIPTRNLGRFLDKWFRND